MDIRRTDPDIMVPVQSAYQRIQAQPGLIPPTVAAHQGEKVDMERREKEQQSAKRKREKDSDVMEEDAGAEMQVAHVMTYTPEGQVDALDNAEHCSHKIDYRA